MATGIATAKLILCGEHAVVYGEPAISVPFSQAIVKTDVTEATETSFSSAFFEGSLDEMPAFLAGIKEITEQILRRMGDKKVMINVMSDVPIGRGLGSSAAVAASIVRGLYVYFKQPLTEKELLHWVNQSEKIAHGKPSGVDAVTVVTGKPVWFEKDKSLELIHFNQKAHFVVADTGVPSETRSAVLDVGHLLQNDPQLYQPMIIKLGDISREIKKYFETNLDVAQVGLLMTEAQKLLEKLTVSDASLEKLIRTALENGAAGAKLTGGGRGGCIISLVENQESARKVADALQRGGAARVWIFTIGEDNQ
ncbi:mevalonate kinase [Listeria costaricensis]|uniref:mevalonate kinase n=1 Tax=Listeria costaricensis TaxID=2026604 RepID=UPI000C07BDA7|nr:mevalonate kinase [Listeria costaricensis]